LRVEGKRLVVIARVRDMLHFRIFDSDGKMIVDTDESRLTDRSSQVATLKLLLNDPYSESQLSPMGKRKVIATVESIVRHVPPRPSDDRASHYRLAWVGDAGRNSRELVERSLNLHGEDLAKGLAEKDAEFIEYTIAPIIFACDTANKQRDLS